MTSTRRSRRPHARYVPPVLALLLSGVLGLGLLAAPGTAAGPAAPTATGAAPAATSALAPSGTPRLSFRDCNLGRCARVQVPLDHDRPEGATTSLFLAKVPARKPARKIGTLFVNPGGPGGPAAGFARVAAQILGKGVRNRFDIVGIDPRGVGRSAPATCEGRADVRYPRVVYPRTAAQQQTWLDLDAAERRLCRDVRILDHMSTADTARDMDLVRRALGEERVSYFGASYGSILGATYAAMFPDYLRAFVVDGVLDPVEWTTGRDGTGATVPVTTRLGSDAGSREALEAGLAACDEAGRPACALGRRSLERWDAVADRLRTDPAAARRAKLSYDAFVNVTLGSLYAGALPGVAELTRRAEKALDRVVRDRRSPDAAPAPSTREAVADLAATRRAVQRAAARDQVLPAPYAPAARPRRTSLDGAFHGVLCSDSVNPASTDVWPTAADAAFAEHRDFGPLWTWSSSACVGWPGSSDDAYRGPFSGPDPARVLVVNNEHDPATPLSGAQALSRELGGAPLLTVADGFGHVATGSDLCATRQVGRFLLGGSADGLSLACTAPPLFDR